MGPQCSKLLHQPAARFLVWTSSGNTNKQSEESNDIYRFLIGMEKMINVTFDKKSFLKIRSSDLIVVVSLLSKD